LAQVQLPPDTDLDSVRRKLAHDLFYIEQLSPWLDFKLLVCTAFYAAGVPFRIIRRILGVPPTATIERVMKDALGEPPQQPRQRMAA
jgi:hypothetical protein